MDEPLRATPRSGRAHAVAVLQALVVTLLWSTSWVLIKFGLDDLDLQPLSFAALRYLLAAAILLPFGLAAMRRRPDGARLEARVVWRVAVYGLLFVAVAQGAQFASLSLLPATAVSLILSSTPAAVALIALSAGAERPSIGQLAGIGLLVAGAILYFGPFELTDSAPLGIAAAVTCVAGTAVSAHVGRTLSRDAIERLGGAIGLTATSMAIGAVVLLTAALVTEGLPSLDVRGWLIVAWLAAVNTAFAFTVWNHTLRTLTAVESSVVNNTMTIQIAVLAIVFLGERPAASQLGGLVLAAAGAAAVQLAPLVTRRRRAQA